MEKRAMRITILGAALIALAALAVILFIRSANQKPGDGPDQETT
jgi:hypothetical protein